MMSTGSCKRAPGHPFRPAEPDFIGRPLATFGESYPRARKQLVGEGGLLLAFALKTLATGRP